MTQVDWATKVLLEGHSYQTEKLRVADLIKDMSLEEMQEFARNYEPAIWCKRCFPGEKPADKCRHAEPGGIVCEVGTSTPLVFIGSISRPGSAVRLVINAEKKTLQMAHNIRAWEYRETEKPYYVYSADRYFTTVKANTLLEARKRIHENHPDKGSITIYSRPKR